MSKNILIIGSYSAEGADSFSWWQELPNLSDYDTIILDTSKITRFWLASGRLGDWMWGGYSVSNINDQDRQIMLNLSSINNKLLEMLEFEVTIYALYEPSINIAYDRRTHFRTDDWCPISIDTFVEKGKTIEVVDESYEEYFGDFKDWEYYFVADSLNVRELTSYYEPKYAIRTLIYPIATNKVKKPLAIELTTYFFEWKDKKHTNIEVTRRKTGGNLILLPIRKTYDTSPLIEILLQRGKEFEETPIPTWLNKIDVPGEVSIRDNLATEEQRLETLEGKIRKLQASLMELRKYKRLLYSTGQELQDICKSTLEEIGANTKPSDVTDEFMIEINGQEALIEVKGNTKSITKDDLSQLIADLAQQIRVSESPNIIRGILVGNAWRELPLDERSTKDIFTRHVVKYAEAQNIGLLSTIELFNAYCGFLEEPEKGPKILDKIINSKGIIKF